MVIVTVFALYPLINLVVPLLQWLLEDTHPLIRTLVSVTIMVLLMTYLVMPVMIRLLSKWLYGTS
jgi:antibiotic biosynthesis monooxygenase (ABM) superfamily enzyme